MWWARFDAVVEPFRGHDLDALFAEMTPGWVGDHSRAHVMERLFGFLVAKAGMRPHYALPWVFGSHTPLQGAQIYRPRSWALDGSEGRIDRVFILNLLARGAKSGLPRVKQVRVRHNVEDRDDGGRRKRNVPCTTWKFQARASRSSP